MSEEDDWLARMTANLERNKQYAKPGPYTTPLAASEEAAFRQWVAQNKVPYNLNDPVQDYDMRGFYKAAMAGDPNASTEINSFDQKMHFPDTYKTPYHESFSRDSQYAQPNAPFWVGGQLLVDPVTGVPIFDQGATKK